MDSKTGSKKTAVITGASSGIGFELSKKLAKNFYIYNLDMTKPEEHVSEVEFISCNLTSPKELEHAFLKIKKIDLLINNAGVMRRGDLFSSTVEDYDLLFSVNLKAYWLVLKYAKSKLSKNAKVVFTSSRHGLNLPIDPALYAITKNAELSLAEIFSKTMPNIDVRVVCPGSTDTALARTGVSKKDLAKKQMHSAEDLARQIVDFIYSDKKKMLYDNCEKKYCFE